jgi:hypothetical protein
MPDRRPAISATVRRELQVAEFAGRRHRVLDLGQLRRLGVSSAAVSRWTSRGRLCRVHCGVYAYGQGALSREGEFLAAVLAIGHDAVLSNFAAAALRAFWAGAYYPIDVTVPRALRSREGIRVHTATLPPGSVTTYLGIPVTTVPYTLLDLAVTARDERTFRRLVHEAEVQELVTPSMLRNEIELYRGHPGAERLLAEIADGPKPTRSGKEDDLVAMLRRHKAPPFETNVHVPGTPGWVEADVLFRQQNLVIEFDGGPWHSTNFRRELDEYKRSLIRDVGCRVLELVDADLEPGAEADTMRRVWGLLELG